MMEEELERVGGILKDFENRHEKVEASQAVTSVKPKLQQNYMTVE